MELEADLKAGRFGYLRTILETIEGADPVSHGQALTFLQWGEPSTLPEQLRRQQTVLPRCSMAVAHLPSSLIRPGTGYEVKPIAAELLLRIGRLLDAVLELPGDDLLPRPIALAVRTLPVNGLDAAELEIALDALGEEPQLLIRRVLTIEDELLDPVGESLLAATGWAAAYRRHPMEVQRSLTHGQLQVRRWALELLARFGTDPLPWASAITAAAVGPSKTEGRAAESLVLKVGGAAAPWLLDFLNAPQAHARARAAELLALVGGAGIRGTLETRQRSDRSFKVRQAIDKALEGLEDDSAASLDELRSRVEPLADERILVEPLSELARQRFRALFQPEIDSTEAPESSVRQALDEALLAIPPSLIEQALAAIQQPDPWIAPFPPLLDAFSRSLLRLDDPHFAAFITAPGVSLAHSLRAFAVLGFVPRQVAVYDMEVIVEALPVLAGDHMDRLRWLAEAFKSIGIDPLLLGRLHMEQGNLEQVFAWGEATQRYFLEYPEVLEEALNLRPSPRGWDTRTDFFREQRRLQALKLMVGMPSLPPRWLDALREIALSGKVREGALARRIVEIHGLDVVRIVEALRHPTPRRRCAAASWLGELVARGHAQALSLESALKEALHAETNDAACRALHCAMAHLDQTAAAFATLTPGELEQEANVGLSRKLPKELDGFPLEDLPVQRWGSAAGASAGKPVPPSVVRWLAVLAIQIKKVQPTAFLEERVDLLEAGASSELGAHLLRAWMQHDVYVEPFTEAVKDRMRDEQEICFESEGLWERLESEHSKTPKGSSMPFKGLLGLVALTATGAIAEDVRHYLTTWYGYRHAQCKVLLETLIQIADPAALGVIYIAAQTVKTKSIREAARQLLESAAAAKDCTVEQLVEAPAGASGPIRYSRKRR